MNSNRIPRSVTIELKSIEAAGNKLLVEVIPDREPIVTVLVTDSQLFSAKHFSAQLLTKTGLFDSYFLELKPRDWARLIDLLMSPSDPEAQS
jgi:hypothetical protein